MIRPKHPSEVLVKLLRDRKWSYGVAQEKTGISAPHLHMLTHGTRSFTPMVAEKLASAGLGEAMEWLTWQAQWSSWKERQKGSANGSHA